MNDTREVVERLREMRDSARAFADGASIENASVFRANERALDHAIAALSPSTGGLTRERVARLRAASDMAQRLLFSDALRRVYDTAGEPAFWADIDALLSLQQGSGGDRKGVEGSLSPSPSPSGAGPVARAQDEAEFEVQQNGEYCASSMGPRERAWADTLHYAAMYGQDGPVEVYEVFRRRVPLPEASPSREPATTARDGTQADQPSQHEGEGG